MKQTKIILTLAVGLLLISCGEDVVEEENYYFNNPDNSMEDDLINVNIYG